MDLPDQLSGLFWLAISIFVCVESIRLGIGSFRVPGPGFLLFLSGIALGALALILVVKENVEKKGGGQVTDLTTLWKGMKYSNVILILLSLFVYAMLLPRVGYVIMTFLLMTFLFIIGKRERARLCVLGASGLITSMLSYVIFHVWLGLQLPKGIFGF